VFGVQSCPMYLLAKENPRGWNEIRIESTPGIEFKMMYPLYGTSINDRSVCSPDFCFILTEPGTKEVESKKIVSDTGNNLALSKFRVIRNSWA
jgi:hypothetical protein